MSETQIGGKEKASTTSANEQIPTLNHSNTTAETTHEVDGLKKAREAVTTILACEHSHTPKRSDATAEVTREVDSTTAETTRDADDLEEAREEVATTLATEQNLTSNQSEGKFAATTSAAEQTPTADQGDATEEMARKVDDFEEGRERYRPGGLHPVFIGDVYNDRYQILRKIGYGMYSTVWLVKDNTCREGDEQEYLAMKILSAESYDEERPVYEREILKHLREADKSHPGYESICHLKDDFEIQGPNGNHICLVFELMGETLHSFRAFFDKHMIPNVLMRKFTLHLLMALDYSHDSGVIHTDIKPDNIFIKFRNRTLITKFLKENPAPQQDRDASRYPMVHTQSLQSYYFDFQDNFINFDVALGDWGVSSWTTKHLSELIQPVTLRSPEVLIGAPWDWTTDWWNLGPVILEVFRAVAMFTGQAGKDSPYDVKLHLEEIEDFFGPFPRSLLDKGDPEFVEELFNEDGTIKDSATSGRPALNSEYWLEDLRQETRDQFVDFLHALMKLDPTERLPTQDLIDMPWIQGK